MDEWIAGGGDLGNEIVVEVEEDMEGTEQFPNSELRLAGCYLAALIDGLVEDAYVEIFCRQDRSGLVFHVAFDDPENNKLFVGPNFRTVNAMLELIRFQQFTKHNRYIVFELLQKDGLVQRISNRRVFGGGRLQHAEQVQSTMFKALNATSRNRQLEALKDVRRQVNKVLRKEENNG